MRDRTGPDPEDRKGTDEATGRSVWGENTGERRRRRTLDLLRERTSEVVGLVEKAVPGLVLMTGVATCAEVWLDEKQTTHRFLRMNLFAPADAIDRVIAALARHGWRASVPGSDRGIIRIAHAHGRRPIHVLFGADDDELTGPNAPAAASDAGRALRERRLRRVWVRPDAVMASTRERSTRLGLEIESLEIQIRRDTSRRTTE
jgi:hypothetical protein